MIITFFNDKPACGKSTLTIHTAKALVNLFNRGEDNTRRVFVFDTVTNINNSLIYKKNQEDKEVTDNERFYVEYLNDYQEFETQKIDFNIQEKDVVFFDLQNFAHKQFDFIINSNYVIIVSDNPNELERIDREMYFLISKLKNYQSQSISQIKKIFLTQNRVSPQERIVEAFEDIDYINGLEELKDLWKIENTPINKITNPPLSIQKFVLEVWKKVNDYSEQVII